MAETWGVAVISYDPLPYKDPPFLIPYANAVGRSLPSSDGLLQWLICPHKLFLGGCLVGQLMEEKYEWDKCY
jgi:hypothetical protein